jgi:hypothetical protein
MKTRTTANVAAVILLAAAGAIPAVVACGGPKQPDVPSTPSTSAEPAASSAPAASTTPSTGASDSAAAASESASSPPLTTVLMTDVSSIQKLYDAAMTGTPATAKDKGVAGNDTTAKGIKEAAKKHASGMMPIGPMYTASLKEKTHATADVKLEPGQCYAIVGYGAKLKDLDLHLFLPPGILSGQDTTDDNAPVIGKDPTPMCPSGSMAVTYKLDMFADQGSGDVAAQLYAKSK